MLKDANIFILVACDTIHASVKKAAKPIKAACDLLSQKIYMHVTGVALLSLSKIWAVQWRNLSTFHH